MGTATMKILKTQINKIMHNIRFLAKIPGLIRTSGIYFGKSLANVPDGAMVIFPCRLTIFGCGLAGIIAFKHKKDAGRRLDLKVMQNAVEKMKTRRLADCLDQNGDLAAQYLGGGDLINDLLTFANALKGKSEFYAIFISKEKR